MAHRDATKELFPSCHFKFQRSRLVFHVLSPTIPGPGPALLSFGRVWRERDRRPLLGIHRLIDESMQSGCYDSVLGLEDHEEDMTRTAPSSNRNLDAWTAGYKARFTSVNEESDSVDFAGEDMGVVRATA